jgi:hypothetical protein
VKLACSGRSLAVERRRENVQLLGAYVCTDSVSMLASNMKKRCDEAKHALLSYDVVTSAWEAAKTTWTDHIQGSTAGYIVLLLVLLVLGGKLFKCCFGRKRNPFATSAHFKDV